MVFLFYTCKYISPVWEIQKMVKNPCFSVKNMHIWCEKFQKKIGLNWRFPWGAIVKTCSLAFCSAICPLHVIYKAICGPKKIHPVCLTFEPHQRQIGLYFELCGLLISWKQCYIGLCFYKQISYQLLLLFWSAGYRTSYGNGVFCFEAWRRKNNSEVRKPIQFLDKLTIMQKNAGKTAIWWKKN